MAKLEIHNDEIDKVIDLIQDLVPEADLKPIQDLLEDVEFVGNIKVKKTFSDGSTVSLELIVLE